MKLKRFLSLLLVVLLLFCAGCGETPASPTEPSVSTTTPSTTFSTQDHTPQSVIQPLLYQVTDATGHKAYLFGSIHVGRENFYPLPGYVTDAFNKADKLAVEFDVLAFQEDMVAQTQQLTKLMYRDGTTIKDHIPEALYNNAVAIMTEKGEYYAVLDYYYPALWANLIDNYTVPEGAMDLGIDVNLIQMAYDCNKPVDDVESADLQYSMLANFSAPLQELLLESSVEGYKNYTAAEVEKMLDIWASGDAKRFREYLSSEDDTFKTDQEQALYEEYKKAMMTDRDNGMTAYVKQALTSGDTVFVCVGAAHVMGENGIVDQLKAAGYTVEEIH